MYSYRVVKSSVNYLFPVITAFFVSSLLLAINLIHVTYGQDNPAADIIKRSQENLKKFENRDAAQSPPPTSQEVPASVSPLPKSKADFTNSNFILLFSKPYNYHG